MARVTSSLRTRRDCIDDESGNSLRDAYDLTVTRGSGAVDTLFPIPQLYVTVGVIFASIS